MKFEEVYKEYENLKDNLLSKKQAIIKKDLDKICELDRELVMISEKLNSFDIPNNNFSEDEKRSLKNLAQEIKNIEENNEILINHSLSVINNTLSGILKIVQTDKNSYNSKGLNCNNEDDGTISSIIEEA